MKVIGGTDVDDGNAGEPDLYWTGCRDGRGVADAAAAGVTKRRREPTSSIERFNVSILPAHTTIIDAAGHGLMSYESRSISLAGARGGRAKFQ